MKNLFPQCSYALSLSLFLLLVGCNKEKAESVGPASTDTYLKFSNVSELKSAIIEISKSNGPNKKTVIEQAIRTHAIDGGSDKFESLLFHPDKNKAVLNTNKTAKSRVHKNPGGTTALSRDLATVDEVLTDQMVPDPNFAAVLSDNLEIQVGDKFIKVTPEGTYMAEAANKAALELMANDNSRDSADFTPGVLLGDDLYNMGSGITRYDTFKEQETSIIQPIDPDSGGGGVGTGGGGFGTGGGTSSPCAIAQPLNSTYPTALLPSQYCGFDSYGYGSHTVVGGLIQSIFGVNSSRESYFDSYHRVKVKLYNFNYWVYSSVGLKAKFQSKSWGIWSKDDCDKIALGWDAVIFEDPMVYSAPAPSVPSFPNGGVATVFSQTGENFKFINFSVPAEMTSELSSVLVGRYGWTQDPKDVEKRMNNLAANSIASVTNSLWDYFYRTYAPGQLALFNSVTKGFRMIFPDKEVIALGAVLK